MKVIDNIVHSVLVISKVCLCVSFGAHELLYEGSSQDADKTRTVRQDDKCRTKK